MAYDKNKLNARKQKRRNTIIRAAITVIAEKGFHKTKIIDIARQAGVADGTIYLYFKNKDDLLIKIFEEILELRLNEIKEVIEKIDNKVERLHKYFYLHEQLFTEHPEELNFFAIELRQSPDFHKKYPQFHPFVNYKNYLKDLCIDAVNSQEIRNVNPTVLMNILFGTLQLSLFQWATGTLEVDIKEVISETIDIIHNGLAK